MTTLDARLKQFNLLSAVNLRAGVFILGKLCIVASIGLAYHMGLILSAAGRDGFVPFSATELGGKSHPKISQSRDIYNVIVMRNIFGNEKKDAPKPVVSPTTTLKLRLVGTNVSSVPDRSFAIIEDAAKRDQDVFSLNESVFNQAKLIEVLPESVKLSYDGKIETLVLEESSGTSALNRPDESPAESQTEFTVAEQEVTDALANLPQLLSQARAVPYFKNGESIGMRLFAIRKGSLYEKLGLKNGDIIRAVNENNLSDPSQALRIFEQLKSERSIFVKLERAGQDLTLRYQVR